MRAAAAAQDHVRNERDIMKKPHEREDAGKPASAPDVMPPHEVPPADPDANPEGTNATIHHPDPQADQHRARGERGKERGPYVTGNY